MNDETTDDTFKINPEEDLSLDTADLSDQFRKLPTLMYQYLKAKGAADTLYQSKKAFIKEFRAVVLLRLIDQSDKRPPEFLLKSQVEATPEVVKLEKDAMSSWNDLQTLSAGVEAIKAKKDMLIQLGADARKEL